MRALDFYGAPPHDPEIEDPLAGCFNYQPKEPLTAPGTECGFLEVPVRRRDGSGFYTYLQCKHRKLVGGKYVYCRFRPRSDHFKDGGHVHKIRDVQITLEQMMGQQRDALFDVANSPCPELYRALAHFAARANVALERAISPEMFDIIWTAASWCFRNANNPAYSGLAARQIFRQISRRTLRSLILRTADDLLVERLRLISQHRYCSVLLDAGTVRQNHWLDFILKIGTLEVPFEVHLTDNLDTSGYRGKALDVLEKLKERGIMVSAFIGDGLPCQVHALNGRHHESFQKVTNLPDKQWQRIIFSPCWVHRVQLVYKHIYKTDKAEGGEFSANIDRIHQIASRLRKWDARRQMGRVCPSPIETRWLYCFDISQFIYRTRFVTKRFLERSDTPELAAAVSQAVHIMKLLEPLKSLTTELSHSESRLGLVFPLLREAHKRLRSLEFPDDTPYARIAELLARELITVTLSSYEGPWLVTAYLLTPQGKAEYAPATMTRLKPVTTTLPDLVSHLLSNPENVSHAEGPVPVAEQIEEDEEEEHPEDESPDPEIESTSDIPSDVSPTALRSQGRLQAWGRLGMQRLAGNMKYPAETAVRQMMNFLLSDITTVPNWETFQDDRPEVMWNLIMNEALHDWRHLARIAERIACIPSSEVPCERAFSLQGYVQTKRNCRSGSDLLTARLVHVMVDNRADD